VGEPASATLPLIVRILFTACIGMVAGNALVPILNTDTMESPDSSADHARARVADANLSNRLVADRGTAEPEYLRTAPPVDRAPVLVKGRYSDTLASSAPSISEVGVEIDGEVDARSPSLVKVTRLEERSASRSYGRLLSAAQVGLIVNAGAIAVLVVFYLVIQRSFARQVRIDATLKSDNRSLERIVAERTRELSELSRHLIRVAEEEKAKLARDLHDELGASLAAMKLDMAYVAGKLKSSAPPLAERLQRAIDTLGATFHLKRRLVADLWPTMLDHLGLAAAIRAHCAEFTLRTGVACVADIAEHLTIEPGWSIAIYRVVQESLTNVAKYARASNVDVVLKRERGALTLRVSDDGVGIAVDAMDKSGSYGVVGMRERISQLGGKFGISRRAQGGTLVEAFIPLARACSDQERIACAGVTVPLPTAEMLVH
jgi:signal transduction histidine kinase